jgi:imidazolonepropionase-like amidohydrolase
MFCSLAASPAHAQTYAIQGATVHTLAGEPIPNGTVVIRDGKIAAVGAGVAVPSGAQVIHARGLHVYPGLFDAVSQLGLTEVGQVSATVDTTELGDFNPHLVAASAIHPASEHIPVARANGVTHAVSAPSVAGGGFFGGSGGSTITGQGSLIHLSGWVTEEMLIRRSAFLVVNWPRLETGQFDFSTFSFRQRPFNDVKKDYDKRVDELNEWVEQARHYAQAVEKGSNDKFARDLKLDAMIPVLTGKLPVLVNASGAREIKDAVAFCEKHKLRMILARGRDAWKVKDLLKEKSIPVILGPSQALPATDDEPYDQPFSTAGQLHAAGVKIAIATYDSADSRTLPYEAANYVPFGLPREEALRAITVNPAEMFGIADRLGTLVQGKVANLIVTTGDPLEITTEVRYLFINGRLTSTDNKHRQLYERYLARP